MLLLPFPPCEYIPNQTGARHNSDSGISWYGYFVLFLVNALLIRLVDGTMATLANQGVVQTLKINLSGNNALMIAYAVANLESSQLERS